MPNANYCSSKLTSDLSRASKPQLVRRDPADAAHEAIKRFEMSRPLGVGYHDPLQADVILRRF